MISNEWLARGAVALALSAAIAGCSDTRDLVRPPPPIDPLFTSYVALGNSITAGFQAGGINSTTQHQSYPVLLAAAMNTPFTVPSLADPGCPPPIDDILTGHRLGDGTSMSCNFRSDAEGVAVINDVAVPGASSFDPTDPRGAGANNALTTFILGGKTQVQRALEARPTFASIWIGNNDILAAALSGFLTPVPGASPGVTDLATFTANYDAMLDALMAGGSLKGGVLIGVVNVARAPIFIPAVALLDPQLKGAADAYVGRTLTLDASCTPSTPAVIDFQLLGAIKAGAQPDTVACAPVTGHPKALGDAYVLDGAEITSIAESVAAFNAAIEARADELGWAYVDPNVTLTQLREAGQIPVIPDLAHPSSAFGAYISLDGIHPAGPAHILIADQIAKAVNEKYGTDLPTSDQILQ